MIVPARLSFTEDGTPYSAEYADVYHSAAGGLGQARHVFLAGNGLPERWRGRDRFVIIETGFGLGLNFLATWQAWCDDPQRCGRLHFISCAPSMARCFIGESPMARFCRAEGKEKGKGVVARRGLKEAQSETAGR